MANTAFDIKGTSTASDKISEDTEYKDLPEAFRKEIDKVHVDFIQVSQKYIDEIKESEKDNVEAIVKLGEKLRQANIEVLRLQNEQSTADNDLSRLSKESMRLYVDTRRSSDQYTQKKGQGRGVYRNGEQKNQFFCNIIIKKCFLNNISTNEFI